MRCGHADGTDARMLNDSQKCGDRCHDESVVRLEQKMAAELRRVEMAALERYEAVAAEVVKLKKDREMCWKHVAELKVRVVHVDRLTFGRRRFVTLNLAPESLRSKTDCCGSEILKLSPKMDSSANTSSRCRYVCAGITNSMLQTCMLQDHIPVALS